MSQTKRQKKQRRWSEYLAELVRPFSKEQAKKLLEEHRQKDRRLEKRKRAQFRGQKEWGQ